MGRAASVVLVVALTACGGGAAAPTPASTGTTPVNGTVSASGPWTFTVTLNADGSFTPTSKITLDLSGLRSDSNQRDGYVKDNVLEIRRFPTAELVPTRATSLTCPASVPAIRRGSLATSA